MRRSVSLLGIPIAVVLVLLVAGCSASFQFSGGDDEAGAVETAIGLIESDAMHQRLNIDPISDAECEEPRELAVGEVFPCTAKSGGLPIMFDVEIDSESSIFASPTNVVADETLGDLTSIAIDALNDQNGFSLPPDSLECGDKGVVLDQQSAMFCVLDDPVSGQMFNVQLTIRDLETGAFGVEIVSVIE